LDEIPEAPERIDAEPGVVAPDGESSSS